MNKSLTIDSNVTIEGDMPSFQVTDIKNEPMLFNCDLKSAYELGGPITKTFLDRLSSKYINAKDFIVDSRVHMLMNGWFPCIPGFHHDDVPRTRSDGQPNYANPEYHAEHVMTLVGDCCPTEFAIGTSEFPEVDLNQKYYKIWHPLVLEKIRNKELELIKAPSNKLIHFNARTWHQGTRAHKDGWRFFIRATINTGRRPTNELRRQVQVYLDAPMEGW